MKKSSVFFSLFIALFISGLIEAISGFVLWIALPSGTGHGRTLVEETFWGLTRHTWLDIHDWLAIALVVIVIIHALLHWPWIVRMTKRYILHLLPRKQSAAIPAE